MEFKWYTVTARLFKNVIEACDLFNVHASDRNTNLIRLVKIYNRHKRDSKCTQSFNWET